MKKLSIAIVVIVIVSLFYFNSAPAIKSGNDELSISRGDLILINKEHFVEKNIGNLKAIPNNLAKNVVIEDDFYVNERLIKPLKDLFNAAKKDGVNHFIINSAFRNVKQQQKIYEEYGDEYALPVGASEHQTGLSLDIGSTQGSMHSAMEAEWLAKNSAKYGFILRYPAHKTHITGISYEPWHYRYVGLPHSMYMSKNDLTLEEYINTIKDNNRISFEENGSNYEIFYLENLPATLPKGAIISGDNINGYIVTKRIIK